jgi:hypothetical protein
MATRRAPAAATEPAASAAPAASSEQGALEAALQALLAPLAALAVARGASFDSVDELLKRAFVQQAFRMHASLPEHRRVSRVHAATGINRREVSRVVEQLRHAPKAPPPRRSLPHEVFAHWLTAPRFRDRRGAPRVLPRQAPADGGPSFEELAQAITRDVHPRSLLDELLRLGLARHDERRDTVRLQRDTAVPQGDRARMLGVLAHNVGDHLNAAVANLLGDGSQHFEQALYAHGLSPRSLDEARTLVHVQWQALLQALVPALEAMVQRDEGQPGNHHRLRLGLYQYQCAENAHDNTDA